MSLLDIRPGARCWCCGLLLAADGHCYLCDSPSGMTSPPHYCLRSGRLITDEHGCAPELPPLEPDHEVPRADG